MEKTKLLTIGIITLFLLNIGTLGFLFLSDTKEHHLSRHFPEERTKPKEIIVEKLHFDAIQIKKYDQLIAWHQIHIRVLEEKIRDAKNELYLQLNEKQANEKTKDSLLNALALYQKEIESVHFKHFHDIKKLCKKDQMNYFSKLTEELAGLFSKAPHHRND